MGKNYDYKFSRGIAALAEIFAVFAILAAISVIALITVEVRSGVDGEPVSAAKVAKSIIQPAASSTPEPTPTPFPFWELTQTYLGNREYTSALGNLTKLSTNSNYTSYLTDYDSEGFEVNGLLTVPLGEEPVGGWPAIVFVHGYIPPNNYRTTEKYTSHVQTLAKEGFVVFKIDLRGHGSSEGDAFGAYYAGDYVIDTLNAFSALESADFVNSKKISLWGHSMAGNITFRAMVANPGIKKAVIWAGAVYTYSDFSDYMITDGSYRPPPEESERQRYREELFETYGQFDAKNDFWRQVPATNYLDGVTGKVQIHHAVNDNVVNIGYSRNLIDVLKGTGVKAELFEYSSGGHNITGSSYSSAMSRTIEFLGE